MDILERKHSKTLRSLQKSICRDLEENRAYQGVGKVDKDKSSRSEIMCRRSCDIRAQINMNYLRKNKNVMSAFLRGLKNQNTIFRFYAVI